MGAKLAARTVLRLVLAASFCLWLGVAAVGSALRLGRSLVPEPGTWRRSFAASLEERRRRTLDERDRAAGRPAGYVSGMVEAIVAHVPEHETVLVTGLEARKDAQALVPVAHLCFPRALAWGPARLTPEWEPLDESYLLAFDEALESWLRARKVALARGPGWTLWR